jgi:hypothetical protein
VSFLSSSEFEDEDLTVKKFFTKNHCVSTVAIIGIIYQISVNFFTDLHTKMNLACISNRSQEAIHEKRSTRRSIPKYLTVDP